MSALLALALSGCSAGGAPSPRLALDGPELVLAAELGGRSFDGSMDRSCMAGVGDIALYEQRTRLTCRGAVDAPASSKGRLYVELSCSDERKMYLVLRNLGPDQGMGMGRLEGEAQRMTVFYHACRGEARRRLGLLQEELKALEPELPAARAGAPEKGNP
jgi:hypothetical protein